jgi:iron complex outermembrane receptor protein
MGIGPRHRSAEIATAVCAVVCALSTCTPLALFNAPDALAATSEPAALSADIPAQPLAQALAAFVHQTAVHLVYVSGIVSKQRSHLVAAGLGADAALARLLQGTGLKFEHLTAHSVRILAAALPVEGQEAQTSLPDVVVTGSRIAVPGNITATSPIQIVTKQDILLSGRTDMVDVLNTLPQTIISSSADFGNNSNPASNPGGFTTVDLRGLGPQRTVVLINGRRLGLGDPNTGNPNPAPDLDQIPIAMIERVEVLTGGASATYGSDAIAGVVNFIMKDHVQGVQIDGQYGFYQHGQHDDYLQGVEAAEGITPPTGTTADGFTRDVSVLAGTGFHDGAGQVTGYFVYHGQNIVLGSARDFADCAATSNNFVTGVPEQGGFACLGSVNSNQFVTDAGQGFRYSVVGNQFVPYPAADSLPPAHFNYAPYNSAQRQDARYQAGLLAHLALNPAVKPYLEFSYMYDHTLTEIAPDAVFEGDNFLTADRTYRVNCSNPLLSAQEAAILCTPAQIAADKAHPGTVSADVDIGRRNIEGSGRLGSYDHRNYRVVGGVGGQLGDTLSYDAYALYYYTSLFQANLNYLDVAAINKALQVTTDGSGRPVCISGGSCVPYNIFTTGAVTAQQLAYLYTPGTDGGSNSEQIVEADITGQLARFGIVSPWAHDGIAFNAGAAHRAETLRFAPDAVELSGELTGYGGPSVAIDKRVSVDEGFLEIRVPIAQELPLTKDLTVDAGYRYSVYSTAGVTNTYKFDLQFAPLADVRLRTSYDRVVRAPNLIELYTPVSYGYSQTVLSDPCAPTNGGATRAAASLTACAHTGVTAAEYGNGFGPAVGGTSTIVQCVATCGQLNGGNPELAPETADSWSLGITFTPTATPTYTGSVDYFHILLKGKIATIPGSITLPQCLATGDPTWCSQIVRTPGGALSGVTVAGGGYVLQTNFNTGTALVSGIDLQMNYRWPVVGRWGTLIASLTGSWLQHNASAPYRGAPSYDCAGLFGKTCLNGSVSPTWRHNLRMTWETPWSVQLSALWRFIGPSSFDNNSPQTLLQYQEEGFFDPVLAHIPSYSYLDLSAVWKVTPHVQLRAGVTNVFDKDPPFLPQEDISISAGGLNSFPPYDVLGRNITLSLLATF